MAPDKLRDDTRKRLAVLHQTAVYLGGPDAARRTADMLADLDLGRLDRMFGRIFGDAWRKGA